MSVLLEVESINKNRCSSISSYVSSDLSLNVSLNYDERPVSFAKQIERGLGIKDKRMLLIFGDLTLTFSGDDLLLESIDSYTNKKKWLLDEVALPEAKGRVAISIKGSTDDDRASGHYDPVYIFNETKNLLLIKLSEERAEQFYRLTDMLSIGMNGENLVSLFLENISID